MDKIKHTGTMNAGCPWCGREVLDSWELWHPELEGGIGMNWRLMWRDYCELVTEMFPLVFGIVSLAIVWVAVIAIALAIVWWCW